MEKHLGECLRQEFVLGNDRMVFRYTNISRDHFTCGREILWLIFYMIYFLVISGEEMSGGLSGGNFPGNRLTFHWGNCSGECPMGTVWGRYLDPCENHKSTTSSNDFESPAVIMTWVTTVNTHTYRFWPVTYDQFGASAAKNCNFRYLKQVSIRGMKMWCWNITKIL